MTTADHHGMGTAGLQRRPLGRRGGAAGWRKKFGFELNIANYQIHSSILGVDQNPTRRPQEATGRPPEGCGKLLGPPGASWALLEACWGLPGPPEASWGLPGAPRRAFVKILRTTTRKYLGKCLKLMLFGTKMANSSGRHDQQN